MSSCQQRFLAQNLEDNFEEKLRMQSQGTLDHWNQHNAMSRNLDATVKSPGLEKHLASLGADAISHNYVPASLLHLPTSGSSTTIADQNVPESSASRVIAANMTRVHGDYDEKVRHLETQYLTSMDLHAHAEKRREMMELEHAKVVESCRREINEIHVKYARLQEERD